MLKQKIKGVVTSFEFGNLNTNFKAIKSYLLTNILHRSTLQGKNHLEQDVDSGGNTVKNLGSGGGVRRMTRLRDILDNLLISLNLKGGYLEQNSEIKHNDKVSLKFKGELTEGTYLTTDPDNPAKDPFLDVKFDGVDTFTVNNKGKASVFTLSNADLSGVHEWELVKESDNFFRVIKDGNQLTYTAIQPGDVETTGVAGYNEGGFPVANFETPESGIPLEPSLSNYIPDWDMELNVRVREDNAQILLYQEASDVDRPYSEGIKKGLVITLYKYTNSSFIYMDSGFTPDGVTWGFSPTFHHNFLKDTDYKLKFEFREDPGSVGSSKVTCYINDVFLSTTNSSFIASGFGSVRAAIGGLDYRYNPGLAQHFSSKSSLWGYKINAVGANPELLLDMPLDGSAEDLSYNQNPTPQNVSFGPYLTGYQGALRKPLGLFGQSQAEGLLGTLSAYNNGEVTNYTATKDNLEVHSVRQLTDYETYTDLIFHDRFVFTILEGPDRDWQEPYTAKRLDLHTGNSDFFGYKVPTFGSRGASDPNFDTDSYFSQTHPYIKFNTSDGWQSKPLGFDGEGYWPDFNETFDLNKIVVQNYNPESRPLSDLDYHFEGVKRYDVARMGDWLIVVKNQCVMLEGSEKEKYKDLGHLPRQCFSTWTGSPWVGGHFQQPGENEYYEVTQIDTRGSLGSHITNFVVVAFKVGKDGNFIDYSVMPPFFTNNHELNSNYGLDVVEKDKCLLFFGYNFDGDDWPLFRVRLNETLHSDYNATPVDFNIETGEFTPRGTFYNEARLTGQGGMSSDQDQWRSFGDLVYQVKYGAQSNTSKLLCFRKGSNGDLIQTHQTFEVPGSEWQIQQAAKVGNTFYAIDEYNVDGLIRFYLNPETQTFTGYDLDFLKDSLFENVNGDWVYDTSDLYLGPGTRPIRFGSNITKIGNGLLFTSQNYVYNTGDQVYSYYVDLNTVNDSPDYKVEAIRGLYTHQQEHPYSEITRNQGGLYGNPAFVEENKRGVIGDVELRINDNLVFEDKLNMGRNSLSGGDGSVQGEHKWELESNG